MSWTILRKVWVGLLSVLVLMALILTFANYSMTKTQLLEKARTKLLGDLQLGYEYLDTKIPGDWEVKDGVLYKGGVKMNDNNAILDEIGELMGGNTVTIFLYDTRVATNIMTADGARAVGTVVSDEVKEVVLNQKERYIGRADVLGHWNQTAYEPIYDKSGNVVGMWYTGVPEKPYRDAASKVAWINLCISLIVSLVLFVMSLTFLKRDLVNTIRDATAYGLQMAKGDFSRPVSEKNLRRKDEIGQLANAFSQIQNNMSDMLKQTRTSTDHVSTAAVEFSKGAQQLQDTARQMAMAIEQIAVGVSEQANHARQILDMMEHSGELVGEGFEQSSLTLTKSKQSTQTARDGDKVIRSVMDHLSAMTSVVEQAVHAVERLGSRSEEIGGIITAITNIAEQTNLLALNAAIEAARAGDQGLGFAVVANEVRKLAEQSAQSANQISGLIRNIQEDMRVTLNTMAKVSAGVEEQVRLISTGSDALQQIVRQTQDTEDAAHEMQRILNELQQNVHEVLHAIQAISSIIEQHSASAEQVSASAEQQVATIEEMAAGAEQLQRMAQNLQQQVEKFKVREE